MAVNRIAYLFAGAVLGAAGMALVKSGKGQELVSGVINGGCGVAENVLARVETIKEDIEDYMAEVKFKKSEAATVVADETEAEVEAVVVNETVLEPEAESLADVEVEIEIVSEAEEESETEDKKNSDS